MGPDLFKPGRHVGDRCHERSPPRQYEHPPARGYEHPLVRQHEYPAVQQYNQYNHPPARYGHPSVQQYEHPPAHEHSFVSRQDRLPRARSRSSPARYDNSSAPHHDRSPLHSDLEAELRAMLARIHTIKQQDPSLVDRVWQEEHRLYKS
jgi:hypothetical protein